MGYVYRVIFYILIYFYTQKRIEFIATELLHVFCNDTSTTKNMVDGENILNSGHWTYNNNLRI